MDLISFPAHIKVFFEDPNKMHIPGYYLAQWSQMWSDMYTSAPYVGTIDEDNVFHTLVIPSDIFDDTGKLVAIGSKSMWHDHFKIANDYLVGKDKYVADFMWQIPMFFHPDCLPNLRSNVERLHPEDGHTFNAIFEKYYNSTRHRGSSSGIVTILNYAYFHQDDKVGAPPNALWICPLAQLLVYLRASDEERTYAVAACSPGCQPFGQVRLVACLLNATATLRMCR